jgi:hypothetical protein
MFTTKIQATKEDVEKLIRDSNFTISNFEIASKLKVRLSTYLRFKKYYGINYNGNQSHKNVTFIPDEEIFIKNSPIYNVKSFLIKKQIKDHTMCEICKIKDWNGGELKMQLDHINGDNTDNRLQNLRFICPNCHSQTETFCRRKKRKKNISDIELIKALKSHSSIYKAVRSLGSISSVHYRRCLKLISENNIVIDKHLSNAYKRK